MADIVTVFGSSRIGPGDPHWEAAERCGRLLAAAGFAVATGGYGGAMEAVSRGARLAGGHVIGVTAPAVFPGRAGANSHVAEERPAATLTERLRGLIDPAVGYIVLPGSIGTLTELMVAWNANYVGAGRPLVAVGTVWGELLATIADRLAVPPGHVSCVDTVDEAVGRMVDARRPA